MHASVVRRSCLHTVRTTLRRQVTTTHPSRRRKLRLVIRRVCAIAWQRKEIGTPLRGLILRRVDPARLPASGCRGGRRGLMTSFRIRYNDVYHDETNLNPGLQSVDRLRSPSAKKISDIASRKETATKPEIKEHSLCLPNRIDVPQPRT